MRSLMFLIRKIVVGIIGFPLLLVGLILVPLPGPRVLVSLVGFFILSFEFDWASKGLRKATGIVSSIYKSAKESAARIDPSLRE